MLKNQSKLLDIYLLVNELNIYIKENSKEFSSPVKKRVDKLIDKISFQLKMLLIKRYEEE